MRLLITGYPGWLTSRFLETLPDFPTHFSSIRCLVSSEHRPEPSLEARAGTFVGGDLLDPASLESACSDRELVLHAAGVIHPKKISDYYRIHRDGTRNLLEACVRKGVRRFIYISSNAAQGFCEGPGRELEESGPSRPESHYGKSKYEAEGVVREYQSQGKIQTVILRPAMFYGPPVPERHLDIYRKIQKGIFYVFGTGEYLRSVTYIDNLVQGIHLAMTKDAALGKTYYLADREIPTLNQLVEAMAGAMGRTVKIIRLPVGLAYAARILDDFLSAMNIYWMLPHVVGESHRHIACSIAKAEKELGYQPAIGFREGYRRTIQWCREQGGLS